LSQISSVLNTDTTTTSSPSAPTAPVFEFEAFPPQNNQERIYREGQTVHISIHQPLGSYEKIELYIRNDDGDDVAYTITDVTNASATETALISVANVGQTVQDIILEIDNIVASRNGGHAFFLVLRANTALGGNTVGTAGLEIASPLFAVMGRDSTDTSGFDGEDITSSEPAQIEDGSPSGASGTDSNGVLNPTPTATTSGSSKGKNSGGLATGAIAGIAVGAAVILIIVVTAIWFILRRRKRQVGSHPTDVSTPLAAGYGGAAGASSREFMGDKEAGAMVAESPQSQAYTDQPDPRHSALSGAAIIGGTTAPPANASYTESGHQVYDEAAPAGHSPTDQQPVHHGSASAIRGADSPVPSTNVARHLVDEDMTADEIARLEEEERELDRQIQEAGRRR